MTSADAPDRAPAEVGDPSHSRSVPDDEEEFTRPRVDRRRTVLGVIVVALVVAAAGLAIAHRRHDFLNAVHRMGVTPLVLSGVIAALSVALTFPIWRSVLRGLGVTIPWLAGGRVFFISQLGKYLPGSVWPVLIQMEAGRARGASRRTMLAANLVTIVLSCAVGLTLASVLLPLSDATALRHYWWLYLALPFLLALLHPRAVPWLLDRLFGLVGREPLGQRVAALDSLRACGWSAASFGAQGLHIAVLAYALGSTGFSTVVLSVGGMALAVCAGVLFIPAPAGAGIRDVVLTLVLATRLGSADALAVVVCSRALLVAVDLLLAGAAGLGAVARGKAGAHARAEAGAEAGAGSQPRSVG